MKRLINKRLLKLFFKRRRQYFRRKNLSVDFHTHIFPTDVPDLEAKYEDNRFPTLKHTCSCGAEIYKDGKSFRKIDDNAWDPEKQIAQMNTGGVDVQVLSLIPVTFTYWADPERCLELSKAQNDFIALVVAKYPTVLLA